MADKFHKIHLYVGGNFINIKNRGLRYIGGRMHTSEVNLGFLSDSQLRDLYEACGGIGLVVEFYYLEPGYTLEQGLRKIEGGWSIVQMQHHHSQQKDITIYTVKMPGPIEAIDEDGTDITLKVIAVDQGAPIMMLTETEDVEPEIVNEVQQDNVPRNQEEQDAEPEIVAEDPVETQDQSKDGVQTGNQEEHDNQPEDESQVEQNVPESDVLGPQNVAGANDAGTQSIPEVEVPDVDVNDFEFTFEDSGHGNDADDEDAGHYENLSDLEPCEEMIEEFRQMREDNTAGTSRSRGNTNPSPEDSPDNSDDGEWAESDLEPSDADSQTDVPSDWFEDVEGSSEDDIFMQRDISKESRRKRLGEMRKKRVAHKRKIVTDLGENDHDAEINVPDAEWYNEADDDENFDLPPESDHEGPRFARFKDGDSVKNLKMHVGLEFSSVRKYKEVLVDWAVRKGFALHFIKSEGTRVTASCGAEGCSWRIHASKKQDSDLCQVKTLKGEHTCAKAQDNPLAKARYIATRMEKIVREHPDLRVHRFNNIAKRKVGVELTYWVGLRAKKYAQDKIRGEDEKEFGMLWDYCETVRSRNPGSTLILQSKEHTEPPMFDRLYYSLAVMREGFLDGCRPLIGLDGCFIKTVHGGQLLTAVGKDGNDNLWPIAIAYVRSENSSTWKWFLEILITDLGGQQGGKWTFISDRQKGLLDALDTVAPECEHRFCLRHLYQNFSVKFKSQELKTLFWRAASAGTKDEWREQMQKIKSADPRNEEGQLTAYDWLTALHPDCWSRAFFRTTCKSDVLVNNICESFNNMILVARDMPVIKMFEWIRRRIMNRIQLKKEGMDKYEGDVCPNIMKKLNKHNALTGQCYPQWAGRDEYEVVLFEDQFVIKFDERTCTCGLFQLNGYPCVHAVSCIGTSRRRIEEYIDDCYKKAAYKRVYSHMVHGVPGKKQYIRTGHQPLKGPEYIPKRGRPKKRRMKGANEAGQPSTRKGLTHTCSRCYELGHNFRTCKNKPHPKSKFNTVGLDAVPRRPVHRSGQRGRRRFFVASRARVNAQASFRARATTRSGTFAATNAPIAESAPVTTPPIARPSASTSAAVPVQPTPAASQAIPTPPAPNRLQTGRRPITGSFIPPSRTQHSNFSASISGIEAAANPSNRPRNKRITEAQALENIRGRSKMRRFTAPWRP